MNSELELPPETHLREYWFVVLRRRRLVLAVFCAILAVAALRSFLQRPVYQAAVQILIERENPSVLSFKEVAPVDAGWGDDYYQTQYKLLQSRALARRTIESMGLLQDPEFGGPRPAAEAISALPPGKSPVMEGLISAFLGRLKVQPVRNSRLVTVAFEAFRPDLAAEAANRLSQHYIQQTLEFRYQTSAEAAQWLRTQIDDQRQKVEAAELSLQKVREKEGIVNIVERRTLLDQKLKELGTALTNLKTQRLEKEALYRQMRAAPSAEELPEVMRSPVVQSLRIELASLDRQQAQLLERYLDQHPEVIKVSNQIQETRKKIASESQRVIRAAQNDYLGAAAQEASVATALEAAKAETLELSRRSVQYDSLVREIEASKEVLNSLLARHKQTDVAQDLKASNIRIVDPAVTPRGPVRPNHVTDLLLGIVVGLGVGLALAFFLDYLDNTLKTPEDVRVQLGVPLLAVIPQATPPATPPLVKPGAQGPFPEGYRVLRTALSYSWPEQRSRVVLVTSTAPGEGKTLTSVNLALTLASMQGRVLLVDGDLRRPRAHAFLKAKPSPGFSDLMVGKAQPSEVVQSVAGTSMGLLASGAHVPSPADLMSAAAVHGLIDTLRRSYDWILIDTPPVGVVADALLLAQVADGVAVVAGAEMVPREAVRQTLDRIVETGARLLGVVLNRADIKRHSYYYGRYYDHYHREARSERVASIRDIRAGRG